jgi:hypothetical protein
LLVAPGSIFDVAPFIAAGGSRGPSANPLVAKATPEAAAQGTNSTSLPQPSPRHAPFSVAVDRIFADLVNGGPADALAADALLAPSA